MLYRVIALLAFYQKDMLTLSQQLFTYGSYWSVGVLYLLVKAVLYKPVLYIIQCISCFSIKCYEVFAALDYPETFLVRMSL
jgi:hypothetical protein